MVPLMTLGIPGDGATAIIMGAFMVQGLALGPQLFTDNPVEVNSIFIGLMMANIFLGILGFLCMKLFCTCDGCTTKSISTHYLCVV